MAELVETPNEEIKPPKREVEILKVLAEKVSGHVKWYSANKRYGFISRCDEGGDLFVHRSVITSFSNRYPSLRSGEEVEFSVVETNQGIEALSVTGPGGQPVKGFRPMYRRYRTTSEPNQDSTTASGQADSPTDENAPRPKSNRRPRGPRRREGAKTGTSESEVGTVGDGQHARPQRKLDPDASHTEQDGDTTAAADGESPNRTVPRQRRRPPPRRTPRHRSAPADDAGTEDVAADASYASKPEGQAISQPTRGGRFRRPFRGRGFYRQGYGNGNGNGNVNGTGTYNGTYNAGVATNGNRGAYGARQAMGDRNGFAPRRRAVGGCYPRAPRRRPPRVVDAGDSPAVNGQEEHDTSSMKPEGTGTTDARAGTPVDHLIKATAEHLTLSDHTESKPQPATIKTEET